MEEPSLDRRATHTGLPAGTVRQFKFKLSHIRFLRRVGVSEVGVAAVAGAILAFFARAYTSTGSLPWQGLCLAIPAVVAGPFLFLLGLVHLRMALQRAHIAIQLCDRGMKLKVGPRSYSAEWDRISLSQGSTDILVPNPSVDFELIVGDGGLSFKPKEVEEGEELVSTLASRVDQEGMGPSATVVNGLVAEIDERSVGTAGEEVFLPSRNRAITRGSNLGSVLGLAAVLLALASIFLFPRLRAWGHDQGFVLLAAVFACTALATASLRTLVLLSRRLILTKDRLVVKTGGGVQSISLPDIVKVDLVASESGSSTGVFEYLPGEILIQTTEAQLSLKVDEWEGLGDFLLLLARRLRANVSSKKVWQALQRASLAVKQRDEGERQIDALAFPSMSYPVLAMTALAMVALSLYSYSFGDMFYRLASYGHSTAAMPYGDEFALLARASYVAKFAGVAGPVVSVSAFLLVPFWTMKRNRLMPLHEVDPDLSRYIRRLIQSHVPNNWPTPLHDPSLDLRAYAFAAGRTNYIALSQGMIDAFGDKTDSIRPIILHELAHVQMNDLHIKNAIGAATLGLVPVSGALTALVSIYLIFCQRTGASLDLGTGLAIISVLVPPVALLVLTRTAIPAAFRERETRADQFAGSRVGNPQLLAAAVAEVDSRQALRDLGISLESKRLRAPALFALGPGLSLATRSARRWLSMHPSADTRQVLMRWPSMTFRTGPGLPLAGGLVTGLMLIAAIFTVMMLNVSTSTREVEDTELVGITSTSAMIMTPALVALGEFLTFSCALRASSVGAWTSHDRQQLGLGGFGLTSQRRGGARSPRLARPSSGASVAAFRDALGWLGGMLLAVGLMFASGWETREDCLFLSILLGAALLAAAHMWLASVIAHGVQGCVLDCHRLRLSRGKAFAVVLAFPALSGVVLGALAFGPFLWLMASQIPTTPVRGLSDLVPPWSLVIGLAAYVALYGAIWIGVDRAVRLLLMRCPDCGSPVSERFRPGLQCPYCGYRLDGWLRRPGGDRPSQLG